jgi:hypothetical protein
LATNCLTGSAIEGLILPTFNGINVKGWQRQSKGKSLTMSTEFDKNSSKWSYYSTDHKNYIEIFFEHFPLKLLDPQKSTFGDVIFGIKLFQK